MEAEMKSLPSAPENFLHRSLETPSSRVLESWWKPCWFAFRSSFPRVGREEAARLLRHLSVGLAQAAELCLAILPVVVCPFEGRAAQDSAQLPLTSGGKKGEGRLKLLSPLPWN